MSFSIMNAKHLLNLAFFLLFYIALCLCLSYVKRLFGLLLKDALQINLPCLVNVLSLGFRLLEKTFEDLTVSSGELHWAFFTIKTTVQLQLVHGLCCYAFFPQAPATAGLQM